MGEDLAPGRPEVGPGSVEGGAAPAAAAARSAATGSPPAAAGVQPAGAQLSAGPDVATTAPAPALPPARVVRVVPDVSGIDREFDYRVPELLDRQVQVGTMVRVPLQGRRVPGWVVADHVDPPAGVRLLNIRAVRGMGPSPDVVELARWIAWRWSGRSAAVLRSASPPRLVPRLPAAAAPARPAAAPARPVAPPASAVPGTDTEADIDAATALAHEVFTRGRAVLRIAPASERWPAVEAAVSRLGPGASVLVLCPSVEDAERVAARLRRRRVPVALMPDHWPEAAAGGRVVVGARAAALAPAPGLAAVLVLDGHDQAYREERVPAWSAWEVAAERAARAGAPCVVTSPCPTVELVRWAEVMAPPRPRERAGWPVVEIVDRRADDPRSGMLSDRLVGLLRSEEARPDRPLVCVVNRRGRARLLACRACGVVARCHQCGSAVHQPRGSAELVCQRCDATRPPLCIECGGSRLSILRPGVARLAEELTALAGVPVAEVSSDTGPPPAADAPILVGTEAVLHRVRRAGTVAFLEIDQELTAPRFRAAEDTLALIARAGRLVGGRPGRVVVQTRLPDHEALRAAAGADPAPLAEAEGARRDALGLPPSTALALISSGEQTPSALLSSLSSSGLVMADLGDGRHLARAPDPTTLADALARLEPSLRAGVRIEVDPLRV